jgi:hypothetical protein
VLMRKTSTKPLFALVVPANVELDPETETVG